jgi:endo-1,3-1,4-beta-glycanase ExoK
MTIRSGPICGGLCAAALLFQAAPLKAGETAPQPATAPAARGGGSFVETFNMLSDRRWYVSDAAYKDRAFSCAEIQTRERYGYGTYEVRMRAGAASGLVSAFFTYNGPEDGDRRTNDEIDFEFLGKDTRGVQLNYFTSGTGGHESFEKLGFDASTTTADYALEWLPDRLRWYVNGRLLREVRASADRPIPSHPSKIMLSIWTGQGHDFESWLGPAAYPGRPITALYERVAFTRMGDPCAFKESIVCR